MSTDLSRIAASLVSGGRGIVPLDAPPAVASAQFALLGIPRGEPSRRAFRELALTADGLERYAGGVVCDPEALRERGACGRRFPALAHERGIAFGVAVPSRAAPLPASAGETVIEGLDGLRGRLGEYAMLGATFAVLGATFRIAPGGVPSDAAIGANVHALARFAACAQEANLVPVVGVGADGANACDVTRTAYAFERVLRALFAELARAGVALDALVLRTAMPSGAAHVDPADVVAHALRTLGNSVPVSVAGIAFSADDADERDVTEALCALNRTMPRRRPWPLTFAYGGELREAALSAWRGHAESTAGAQHALIAAVRRGGLAACGAGERAAAPPGSRTAAVAA